MIDFTNPEFDSYRLVLISGRTSLILLDSTPRGGELPRVLVPRWTRATDQIQAIARDRWGLNILVLEFLGDEPGGDGIVVAEVLDKDKVDLSPGCAWASLHEIRGGAISDQESALLSELARGGGANRGPFFRLGWIRDLYDWIESIPAADEGYHFTDDVKQLSASPTSALLRLKRADQKYFWFKAAEPPNTHESQITGLLAGFLPGYLPTVIASHGAWHGWLMEDAGRSLDTHRAIPLCTFEQVFRRLAELQRASVDHVQALIEAGCRDQRTPALLAGIHELLPYLHEAMARQQLDCVPKIEIGRLRVIEEVLEQACFGLEWLSVPNSLNHGDIHPGNILTNGRACSFTDWARASIGNPFVTFIQLREHLFHERQPHVWLPRLTKIYQNVWEPLIPGFVSDRILDIIPIISSASSLVDRRELLISNHSQRPELQRYVRSLVRQMDKAARALEPTLTVCA